MSSIPSGLPPRPPSAAAPLLFMLMFDIWRPAAGSGCVLEESNWGLLRSGVQLICMSALYTDAYFLVEGVKHDEPAAFNISAGYSSRKWTFLISEACL